MPISKKSSIVYAKNLDCIEVKNSIREIICWLKLTGVFEG